MSRVNDLWLRKDRTRTARYGKGKRWQAIRTDGRGAEEKRSFDLKDEATEWAHDKANPLAPVTFREYATAWLTRQVQHRPASAEAVERRVRLNMIPALGDDLLGEVTRADVQDAVAQWSGDLAPQTVRFTYQYLSTIFRDAMLDKIIDRSPCQKIRLPELANTKASGFTEDEVTKLAGIMPSDVLTDAVWVAAGTGARPGEWSGFTADRVNVRRGLVTIDRQLLDGGTFGPVKTIQSDREVSVGPWTLAALKRRIKAAGPDGLLFHRDELPFTRARLGYEWRTLRADNPFMGGKGSGWHRLRHAHSSNLLSQGASVVAVSKRLGHKDATETLRTYSHVMPDDDAGLAVLGDLGDPDRHETATDDEEAA